MPESTQRSPEDRVGLRSRVTRCLSFLRNVAGWRRTAYWLAEPSGAFEIDLGKGRLAGNLTSYIEREAYLFGGYEFDQIARFLSLLPPGGTILDVGANVGNHSILFAAHFDRVIAFEPNPLVLEKLRRNVDLSRSGSGGVIDVRDVGLGAEAGSFPLFNIENGNEGLATFSPVEQYDQELRPIGTATVAVADDLLGPIAIAAVKVDVQGLEADVLRGMQRILAENRPLVWTEIGLGTLGQDLDRAALQALFPYAIDLLHFRTKRVGPLTRLLLDRWTDEVLAPGDYVILPSVEAAASTVAPLQPLS